MISWVWVVLAVSYRQLLVAKCVTLIDMTSTPPSSRPQPRKYDLTLDEFSDWLHAEPTHAGELAHGESFADTVRGLQAARAAVKMTGPVSKRLGADMRAFHDSHRNDVGKRTYGDRVLRFAGGAEGKRKRVVEPAVVKKERYAAWDTAWALKPRIEIATTDAALLVPQVDGLDDLYQPSDEPRLRDLYQAKQDLLALCRPFAAAEKGHVLRLMEIAEITEWDGVLWTFRDGWKVATNVAWFDQDTFKVMYPLLFEKYAIEKLVGKRDPSVRFAAPTTGEYKMINNQWTWVDAAGQIDEQDEQDGE